jgi:uncharacterized protein involved in outer membrane biogenesis
MRKKLVRILKILTIVVFSVVLTAIALGFLLNSSLFQNKLMTYSTQVLSEKLHTEVKIDSVSVGVFNQCLFLRGVKVKDLQQRDMLQLDLLSVSLEWLPLLQKEVHISSATVRGLHAQLYRPSPDSVANYQFLIDAFKKEQKLPDSLLTSDIDTLQSMGDSVAVGKKKMELNIRKLEVEDISLIYNNTKASVGKLSYKYNKGTGKIVFNTLKIKTDNQKPRKNTGKPHRGAFDAGHLNITTNGDITMSLLEKDTLIATVNHLDAEDPDAGMVVKVTKANIHANSRQAHISELSLAMGKTTLDIPEADVQLPSKKAGRQLFYTTSTISARVILSDIAKPFAPVLSKFNMPLSLTVQLSGDDNSMRYNNIRVATLDRRLQIAAKGRLTDLKNKYKMVIRFDVEKMTAKRGVKEEIINLFPVKKLMTKQLEALGDIEYRGNLAILRKREEFQGLLTTAVGHLDFQFALDENNKYVIGSVSSSDANIGEAFNVKSIGTLVAAADFKVDISKPRTAKMRKQKGGKLPIGEVSAKIEECKYKKLKVRNLMADITSDGAVAEGNIAIKGRHTDLLCAFSYTSTDSVNGKLKIKPGIRFHKLSEEDRQAKKETKEARKQQKKEKAEQRRLEKAKAKKKQADNVA